MPIYEYLCHGCNHITEVLHKADEKIYPECSRCGGLDTEKQLSTGGFILIGDGFYKPSRKIDDSH